MLPTERLAEIADYCKVETDDAQLPGFVAAASGYLAGAGVSEPEDGTLRAEIYLQCIKYQVLSMYDRREGTVDGTASDNPVYRQMMNQLKQSEPVSNVGTGDGAEVGT
uniref:Phage gp6-like head-tail connector protein n=1 Tax=Siphoviridae sp. cty3u30 TaxID=2825744 RepID=A0A8S5Q892_9CAUD|nr:MAG TPA: hypothetical protein [Siphoviridae sp. cty3u30]